MGITKLGLKLAEEVSSLVKLSGKRSVLQTKPIGQVGKISLVNSSSHIPISMRSSMKYEDAVKMTKEYKGNGFSSANREVKMKIDGNDYTGRWLDGGGSKCAYNVKYNGEDICVLLPHKDWLNALREAQNTKILKNMGFLTNDYCKIVPVQIENEMLPALITKPYSKHSFKIFDKKNPTDDIDKYIDLDALNEGNAMKFMESLIEDCKKMAEHKLTLGGDSYNIALVNGKPRLYLNDLPYNLDEVLSYCKDMPYKDLLKDNLREAISALHASFSWDALDTNTFVKNLGKLRYQDELIQKILSEVKM